MVRVERRVPRLAATGVALGILIYVLLASSPEIGSGPAESSWAPHGLLALRSTPFLVVLTALALIILIVATRPPRRATPITFFDAEERALIRAAIAVAERRTSGEIRVHLAMRTQSPALDAPRVAAEAVFEALGMTKTAERNGVLIYLSVADHRFAVVGDKGIDDHVPPHFWDAIRNQLAAEFKRGRFAPAIAAAIAAISEELAKCYPCGPSDVNELPDDISTEE
jgi:uncharacterized membrane protein